MAISRRRRSTISAIAPAGSASSMIAKLSAASTSATIDGEGESDVISQPAPTSCIQLPTLATIVAIQRLRKSEFRSGLQADATAGASVDSAGFTDAGGSSEARIADSAELHHDLIDVAPAPAFFRFERSHDRVLRRTKMLRRVLVLRIVTAAHVSAGPAQAKVHPGVAHGEASAQPTYFSTTSGGRSFASPAS